VVLHNYSSFIEIRKDLKSGLITCVSLVEYYVQNIKGKAYLNVFLDVYEVEALERAKEIDLKIKEGKAGKLAGMVIGLKDVICLKDHGLQAGSRILDGFESQFTGTPIEKLLDEDAIIIGRQNCDEFAMGSSTENSAFGPTLNDADNTKVPGGSSGASAVSVQADMCQVALGTDTGGSVRQPAAFCGIIGLKPTYSRVSRHGLLAYASSFDTIGIFSKSIEDNALVLEVMAGEDEFDSTVSRREVPQYSESADFSGKVKIAYINETLDAEGLNKDIKEETVRILNLLRQEGHEVAGIDFPLMEFALPTYYILTTAEASSNLSRYDGVRYGYRSENTKDLMSLYKKSRTEGFGEEVKRRILLGTFVLSADYHDAYYTKAQKVRRLIMDKTKAILSEYDFIILPTTPTTAFKIGQHSSNPLEMYLADLFTVQASVAGIPAISIPNGKDEEGMPIGLQIMSKDFSEESLFAFSKYLMGL